MTKAHPLAVAPDLANETRSVRDIVPLYEEARACMRSFREARALELLQEVIWLDPGHGEAMSFFALCLAKLHGEYDQALEVCALALASDPENIEIHTNVGRIHRLMGNRAEARRAFVAAYNLDPTSPLPASELARLGVRRAPVLSFLDREHWCNRVLGRLRHRLDRATRKNRR